MWQEAMRKYTQSTETLESQNNDGHAHLDRYRQTKKLFPRSLSSHFRQGPQTAQKCFLDRALPSNEA